MALNEASYTQDCKEAEQLARKIHGRLADVEQTVEMT